MKHSLTMMVCLAMLSACAPEMDMQGRDPKDVYRDRPIKNKVEKKTESQLVRFESGSQRLSPAGIDALRGAFRHVSPMAVESVTLQVNPSQQLNQQRHEHLRKLLANMGFRPAALAVEPTESVSRDEVRIHVDYASVVSPRCPDWRTSPVTTYSNTSQAGWSCAYVNNMGLMVADPRDIERGSGNVSPDVRRNSEVLTGYHSNTGGASATEGEDSGSSAANPAQPQATGP